MTQEEYNDDISDKDIEDLISKADSSDAENVRLRGAVQAMSTEQRDGNFLHFQISTDEMLDKLEHFYKSDYQGYDDEGDLVWKEQTNKELVTFNEFGVSSLMEIISKYIDKNTILSDYPEQRIYEILSDLGEDLILFILCNYNKMGMDTNFKKTKFRLIITTTTHMIESTYRRAKGGKTLTEINQSRVVGQFGNPNVQSQGRPRKEGFFERVFN